MVLLRASPLQRVTTTTNATSPTSKRHQRKDKNTKPRFTPLPGFFAALAAFQFIEHVKLGRGLRITRAEDSKQPSLQLAAKLPAGAPAQWVFLNPLCSRGREPGSRT